MYMRDLIPFGSNRSLARGSRHPFDALQREMNRMFDEVWRGFDLPSSWDGDREGFGRSAPRVDVSENQKEVRVTADLPGLEEKDIDVTFSDGVLTIRGEKTSETEDKGKEYYVKERSYGSFHRALPIDVPVKEDKIKATFKNGVLNVVLPKTKEAEDKAKRIPISH